MPVPIVYRKSGEGAVASYDGFDFANGTGYKKFYGIMLASGATTSSGALVTETIYSDKIDTGKVDPAANSMPIRLKFTTSFNVPMILRGDAIINIPVSNWVSGGGTTEATASVALYHVSNGVTTLLGNGKGTKVSQAGAGTKTQVRGVKLNVAKTKLKKHDQIYLIVDLVIESAETGGVAILHDPAGRAPSSTTAESTFMTWAANSISTLIVDLPFVIDL